VLEASYVGNRAVWVYTNNMVDLNGNTAEGLKAKGFDVTNRRRLRGSDLGGELLPGPGPRRSTAPYATFPLAQTVAQALRPFPQFGVIPMRWSPTGNSWYDALQTKATKRLSKGLDAMASFTWQRELTTNESANINNVYNRACRR